MLEQITNDALQAITELIFAAKIKKNDVIVIGCSTSEVSGHKIGCCSSTEIADAIFNGIYPTIQQNGLFLAVQCCEHLNRAIVIENSAAELYRLPIVNVVPQPKAGGSFATVCYQRFDNPVVVEEIHCAKAGLDIGNTLIGMHLTKVAVPLRLNITKIGEAPLVCARTRPKFIGGIRAVYDHELL
ncbi:MAG: TIGR01440 family protein [Oscillospiraceae bacterium]